MPINIISTGSFVSDEILTNEDLSKIVDTNDQWIRERTGIVERRIARNNTTEELAYEASRKAIEEIDLDIEKIGLILFASVTNDTKVPSSAFTISGKLGIKNAICMDINAACSGFVFALTTAKALMLSQKIEYALVIGAEKLSKVTNWKDRTTCILFGDGAGATLLKNSNTEDNDKDILEQTIKGQNYELCDQYINGKYDENNYLTLDMKKEIYTKTNNYIEMNGRQIYKFATNIGPKMIDKLLADNNIELEEIAGIICHQANLRIIETLAQKTGIDIEKWFINIEKYGNTSSASVALAIDEYRRTSINNSKGKYIICIAFGGGLSYGSILLKII